MINTYIKKKERSQSQPKFSPPGTGERRTNWLPEVSKRKKIKIEVEIKEIETRKAIQKINETKSWFLEKVNKIDKPLAKPN